MLYRSLLANWYMLEEASDLHRRPYWMRFTLNPASASAKSIKKGDSDSGLTRQALHCVYT